MEQPPKKVLEQLEKAAKVFEEQSIKQEDLTMTVMGKNGEVITIRENEYLTKDQYNNLPDWVKGYEQTK